MELNEILHVQDILQREQYDSDAWEEDMEAGQLSNMYQMMEDDHYALMEEYLCNLKSM